MDWIGHIKGTDWFGQISYPPAFRDNAGNPQSMTDWTGTWNYGYDANNRLAFATPPNPIPDQPCGGDYGYDWVGNRLNPPAGPNPMVYNKVDQLTSWPGMYNYVYNLKGHLTQTRQGSGTSVLKSYTYTDDDLLDTASFSGRSIDNTWDADGNRVAFTATSGSHTFVNDITAGIPAVIKEDDIYYFREPGGSLISRVQGTSKSYYHYDELGSTRLLTDANGNVTDKYAYDAYGAVVAHNRFTGSVNQPYQYVGELGYYTHWQEPEFGLLQLGVRFYDPEVGRFTQEDPIGDGLNWYGYVENAVLQAIDPTGMLTESQCDTLKEILDYEKKYGTVAAANHYSNTWGAEPMGKDFDNQPILTLYGVIDLDWYTDVRSLGASKWTVGLIYPCGKIIENILRFKWVSPYDDYKEKNAVMLIADRKYRYADLFPPSLMKRECGKYNKKKLHPRYKPSPPAKPSRGRDRMRRIGVF